MSLRHISFNFFYFRSLISFVYIFVPFYLCLSYRTFIFFFSLALVSPSPSLSLSLSPPLLTYSFASIAIGYGGSLKSIIMQNCNGISEKNVDWCRIVQRRVTTNRMFILWRTLRSNLIPDLSSVSRRHLYIYIYSRFARRGDHSARRTSHECG